MIKIILLFFLILLLFILFSPIKIKIKYSKKEFNFKVVLLFFDIGVFLKKKIKQKIENNKYKLSFENVIKSLELLYFTKSFIKDINKKIVIEKIEFTYICSLNNSIAIISNELLWNYICFIANKYFKDIIFKKYNVLFCDLEDHCLEVVFRIYLFKFIISLFKHLKYLILGMKSIKEENEYESSD